MSERDEVSHRVEDEGWRAVELDWFPSDAYVKPAAVMRITVVAVEGGTLAVIWRHRWWYWSCNKQSLIHAQLLILEWETYFQWDASSSQRCRGNHSSPAQRRLVLQDTAARRWCHPSNWRTYCTLLQGTGLEVANRTGPVR